MQPGAITTGLHRKRPVCIWFGKLSLLLVFVVISLMLIQGLDQSAVYRHAPVFYLLWNSQDDAARDELRDRMNQGRLSQGQIRQLADHALVVQGDKSILWNTHNLVWGAIFEEAYAAGAVTQAQLDRYINQSFDLELQVRPRVQQGRTPHFQLVVDGRRVGPTTEIDLVVHVLSMEVNGEPLDSIHHGRPGQPNMSLRFSKSSIHHRAVRWPIEEFIKHRGAATIDMLLEIQTTIVAINGTSVALPTVKTQEPLQFPLEVTEEPTGDYLSTELPLDEQVKKASIYIRENNRTNARSLVVVMRIDQTGKTLSSGNIEIWILADGKVYPLQSYGYGYRGGPNPTVSFAWDLEKIKNYPLVPINKTVDLLIFPDINRAEIASFQQKTWLGQWIFRDVPLDATPVTVEKITETDLPPSLVTPEVRYLTFEDADRNPTPADFEPKLSDD